MMTFSQFLTESEAPKFTSAEHVRNHVEKHYPGVDLSLHDSPASHGPHTHLSMIEVPKEHQRKGVGSKIMKHVCDYADHAGRTVTLSPEHRGKGQPSKAKLEDWYKDFGFKSNLGRKRDYRYSGTMLRRPSEK